MVHKLQKRGKEERQLLQKNGFAAFRFTAIRQKEADRPQVSSLNIEVDLSLHKSFAEKRNSG